jgi:cytochrome c
MTSRLPNRGYPLFAAILLALILDKGARLASVEFVHPAEVPRGYIIEGTTTSQRPSSLPQEENLPEIGPLLAKADAKRGQQIAKKCIQCHTFDAGGPQRIGPNLHGIVNQKAGQKTGFPYSKDLLCKDITWTPETLNLLLHKPRALIPGTRMSFAGLSKAEDRADVIAYLQSLSTP